MPTPTQLPTEHHVNTDLFEVRDAQGTFVMIAPMHTLRAIYGLGVLATRRILQECIGDENSEPGDGICTLYLAGDARVLFADTRTAGDRSAPWLRVRFWGAQFI